MHALSLPANIFTSAVSNALSGLTSRVSTTARSFASDLQQAQSGSGAISSSLTQLGSDLQSGSLSAAQADYASLQQAIALKKAAASAGSHSSAQGTGSSSSDSVLAALQNSGVLQQSAYNSALNLSMPAAASSISLNI